MHLSVCIEAVFNGRDFIESMKTTKDTGIDAFEFWTWWDKDIGAISRQKEKLGLETAALCTKFISLTDPAQRQEYLIALRETITVTKQLQCKIIISQVGDEIPGVPRKDQHDRLVRGLRECAPMLEDHGVTLVFEPLNTTVNHPGYYLWSSDEAFEIQEEVGSRNVKVLYDIYHQQIMEGNLISRITANISKIGHFHTAGNPGRHELDKGELNYREIFKAIGQAGYTGYAGLEYFTAEDPIVGLKRAVEMTK